ncbi:MAG: hypothetical protein ACYDDA_16190 [Acidiferrobacteraceae bacterium]
MNVGRMLASTAALCLSLITSAARADCPTPPDRDTSILFVAAREDEAVASNLWQIARNCGGSSAACQTALNQCQTARNVVVRDQAAFHNNQPFLSDILGGWLGHAYHVQDADVLGTNDGDFACAVQDPQVVQAQALNISTIGRRHSNIAFEWTAWHKWAWSMTEACRIGEQRQAEQTQEAQQVAQAAAEQEAALARQQREAQTRQEAEQRAEATRTQTQQQDAQTRQALVEQENQERERIEQSRDQAIQSTAASVATAVADFSNLSLPSIHGDGRRKIEGDFAIALGQGVLVNNNWEFATAGKAELRVPFWLDKCDGPHWQRLGSADTGGCWGIEGRLSGAVSGGTDNMPGFNQSFGNGTFLWMISGDATLWWHWAGAVIHAEYLNATQGSHSSSIPFSMALVQGGPGVVFSLAGDAASLWGGGNFVNLRFLWLPVGIDALSGETDLQLGVSNFFFTVFGAYTEISATLRGAPPYGTVGLALGLRFSGEEFE